MSLFSTPQQAVVGVALIIAVAVVLQTTELLFAYRRWSRGGVWRFETLSTELVELPLPLRLLLRALLPAGSFVAVLLVRLLCALVLLVWLHPVLVGLLFVTTLLVAVRWRGTFNGGSDCMTLVVLTGLGIATVTDEPRWSEAGLWYIAVQSCLSYFIAGATKLRASKWRSGAALVVFVHDSCYGPGRIVSVLSRPWLRCVLAWGLMLFECCFPLAVLDPGIALWFVGAGLVFHTANVYVLGLNRFLFAWAATYPALLWCAWQS